MLLRLKIMLLHYKPLPAWVVACKSLAKTVFTTLFIIFFPAAIMWHLRILTPAAGLYKF
jgi:hypothetical protein